MKKMRVTVVLQNTVTGVISIVLIQVLIPWVITSVLKDVREPMTQCQWYC